jgi:hypothetical protein
MANLLKIMSEANIDQSSISFMMEKILSAPLEKPSDDELSNEEILGVSVKKSRKDKKWPEGTPPSFAEVIEPIKAILEEGYTLKRKAQKTFEYFGFNYGKVEAQLFPPVKARLTESGLKEEKEKYERNLIDVLLHITYLLGIEQGRRVEKRAARPINDIISAMEVHRRNNLLLRGKIDQLEITVDAIKNNPSISKEELDLLIKKGSAARRSNRIDEFKKELGIDPSKSSFTYTEKYKASFKELVNLANACSKDKCSLKNWVYFLHINGWTYSEWDAKCKKKNINNLFSTIDYA